MTSALRFLGTVGAHALLFWICVVSEDEVRDCVGVGKFVEVVVGNPRFRVGRIVEGADLSGRIHVHWDNGRTLSIRPEDVKCVVNTTEADILNGRIVNGQDAALKQFPYHVRLIIQKPGRSLSQCGGSIVGGKWILTAAHCVVPKPRKIKVQIGYLDIDDSKSEGTEEVLVDRSQIHVHEDYQMWPSYAHDIALLKLNRTKDLPSNVIVEMGDLNSSGGATVTGWGRKFGWERGTVSKRLQWASVPLLEDVECEHFAHYNNSIMMCAGLMPGGGMDACKGDSGSPLVQGGRQIGIVSYAGGCDRPYVGGVYTRVSAYAEWVKKIIGA